jgi:hypothetical protein
MNDKILEDLGWQDIMPRYVHVPLSSINVEWLNGYYINIPRQAVWPDSEDDAKAYFRVFESFVDSFLRMFNLSSTKKDKDTVWTAYFDLMKKEHTDRNVKLYINNSCGHAVAIVDEDTTPLPADISLEMYEWLKLNGHNVSRLCNEEDKTEFIILSSKVIRLFNGKYGTYRIGGIVSIPHCGNTIKIYGALEHCSTQNVAIVKNKSVSINVDAKDRQPEDVAKEVIEALATVADADKSPFYKLIIGRLKTSRKTIASIQECLDVNELLAKKMEMPLRAARMELHKTLDHYGIVCPNVPFIKAIQFSAVRRIGDNILIESKSTRTKWLSTNPSHIDRLQLFHLLVDTMTEWDTSPEDIRKFQERVGDFLFSMGDLEDTNAQRLFALPPVKRKTEPRDNADIIDIDDNSDILSDFDSEGTDTMSDTDDLQSDLGD